MASSQFDESLLEPYEEAAPTPKGFNEKLLEPEEEKEEQYLAPKKEGIGTWLPRDIMIGLLNQRQNVVNIPHDTVHGLESLNNIRKLLSFENYIGKNPPKPTLDHPISKYLPQEHYNIEKLMGQEGTPDTTDWLLQKGIEHAPELLGLRSLVAGKLPISTKGIVNKLSKDKQAAISQAKTEYGNLFSDAEKEGLTHVMPPESARANKARITANTQTKHNKALNEYIKTPTLENAHWAQSELGALERHMEGIANKNGLTPTQTKTLKAVQETRKDIKDQMFSNHYLGSKPHLADRYSQLATKYKENVIPYTRLQELSEAEANRMLPKTAVNKLLNDDQFKIELAKKYPGLFLHKPGTKKALVAASTLAATLGGYKGIKELLK
jgi:hypothetical protein